MAKDRVEQELDQLKGLRRSPPSEAGIQALRKALKHRVNVIVAKSAETAGEWQSSELMPELLAAFARLIESPARDPQCWGKNAISKTLKELGHRQSDVFLRGLHFEQWESNWGGKVDTATTLRATCALALVQCHDLPRDEIMRHLVDALTDSDSRVRADAARAIAQMNGSDAILLLRLKARAGDKEPAVTGQVLECLLQLEGGYAVPFVVSFLKQADQLVAEEAALALGASRIREGVQVLISLFEKHATTCCNEITLRAIGLSRLDVAMDFLIEQIRSASPRVATAALKALEFSRDSEQIVHRIGEAAKERQELQALFEQIFTARH